MAKNIRSKWISEPLNGTTSAKIDIHAGDGNLTIDQLTTGEEVLVSGSLEFAEKQGLPNITVKRDGDEAVLSILGNQDLRPRFRLPWSACNGATNWLIHLNPTIIADLTAHSDGGNLKLDLSSMSVTRLSTDTGGGNITIVLPDSSAYLSANAKTGAGNVEVSIPSNVGARIHATTGLGKLIMDPHFVQIDKNTYQLPEYESASKKVDFTASSGAGNVIVSIR